VSATSPSGEQHEIRFEEQAAVVTEVGAGLRTYTVGERELLDGYGPDEMCRSGRGQVLLPWPNRIEDGRYDFRGRGHQLPLTEPAASNAIHGFVRWHNWAVGERSEASVVLGLTLYPQPGYPFALGLSVEYSLSRDGLRVTTTAKNEGAEPCPFGCGAHPYLTVGTERVDTAALSLPARTVLLSSDRGIPVGTMPVEEAALDFGEERQIGATTLDHCFTDLERDAEGIARVELAAPGGGQRLTLWMDESYRYVMVFTGDPLPDVARRSVAVEPMTCPPNAFRTGEGVTVLKPGASTSATWGLVPS
jgi:aldose 1-epimerase